MRIKTNRNDQVYFLLTVNGQVLAARGLSIATVDQEVNVTHLLCNAELVGIRVDDINKLRVCRVQSHDRVLVREKRSGWVQSFGGKRSIKTADESPVPARKCWAVMCL